MAKAKTEETAEVATEEQTAVAVSVMENQLPADLMSEISDLDDLGFSQKSEDSMIPILAILQDNSGEVKARHSKRIEGAAAGDMIIRSLQRVIPMSATDAPMTFQPCAFQHVWVEWQGETGEGVPVGQYDFESMPEGATEQPDPQDPERKIWVLPNGNRLVDTRYHFGHIIGDDGSVLPLVIPMSGTNHTVSRQWTATMKQFTIPGTNKRAPAFMRAYAITTKFRERGAQSWYNYQVKDLGWITDQSILRQGLDMLRSVTEQKVRADIGGMAEGGSMADDELPI